MDQGRDRGPGGAVADPALDGAPGGGTVSVPEHGKEPERAEGALPDRAAQPEPAAGDPAVKPSDDPGRGVPVSAPPVGATTGAPAELPPASIAGRGMFGVSGTGDTSGYGGLVRRRPPLRSSPRPYGGWFDEATDALAEA